MRKTAPVTEWGSDFDVLDPDYVADPFGIWDELRTSCPIAHTDRRGSTWLPTRYDDVTAIAHDIEHFSSLEVAVIPFEGEEPEEPVLPYGLPPDLGRPAPAHLDAPVAVAVVLASPGGELRGDDAKPVLGAHRRLHRRWSGRCGLGLRPADPGAGDRPHPRCQPRPADTFTGWVRDVLEFADDHERRVNGVQGLLEYFIAEVAQSAASIPVTTC